MFRSRIDLHYKLKYKLGIKCMAPCICESPVLTRNSQNEYTFCNYVFYYLPWIRMCFFRCDDCLKLFWQILQMCGLSSEWILMWTIRAVFFTNVFPHVSQKWFPLLWTLMWSSKRLLSLKRSLQMLQTCRSLSAAWISMCFFRCCDRQNLFLQISHM